MDRSREQSLRPAVELNDGDGWAKLIRTDRDRGVAGGKRRLQQWRAWVGACSKGEQRRRKVEKTPQLGPAGTTSMIWP